MIIDSFKGGIHISENIDVDIDPQEVLMSMSDDSDQNDGSDYDYCEEGYFKSNKK